MKKIMMLAAMAAMMTAVAEMKVGTVNMVDLVRLHPDHEKNRALVKTTDSDYKAKLDAKQDELKEIAEEGKKALDAAGIAIPFPQMDVHVNYQEGELGPWKKEHISQ